MNIYTYSKQYLNYGRAVSCLHCLVFHGYALSVIIADRLEGGECRQIRNQKSETYGFW